MVDAFFAVFQRPNFLTFVIIFLWGFYIMVTRYNLVKKLIGLYLVQTSVIFFLVSISAKKGATGPVLLSTTEPVLAASYANPLPHAVSLTDSLGAFLMLVGIALHEGLGKNSLKILVVLALLYILNPVSAHATVRAALRSGLKPWKKETS